MLRAMALNICPLPSVSAAVRALVPVLVVVSSGCVHRVAALPPDMPTEQPPPGMVALNFASDDPGRTWRASAGNEVLCDTPCASFVSPASDLLLASGRDGLYVPNLRAELGDAKRAFVIAESGSRAKQVNGIVFTTFGGMGTVVAITLTAVGCSDVRRRGGMCTAGLITGAVSVPMMAVFIWMLADSGPKLHLLPIAEGQPSKGRDPVSVAITPTGLAGTF